MRSLVAILTGGGDRPYALGLATTLKAREIPFDFIGSDDLQSPDLCNAPSIRFLNLRGDQSPEAPFLAKVYRLAAYYLRLIVYAATAEPTLFHILWNNKFEHFDRTFLQLYYRALGKYVVLTVHNVNIRKRDGNDGRLNRFTLKCQYTLAHHLFVHTQQMKRELQSEFGVSDAKISVIPFGVNSTTPETSLTPGDARKRLGLSDSDKVVLFFGNIAPYKGLEFLVDAIAKLGDTAPDYRLVIVGRPKGSESYWSGLKERIADLGIQSKVIERIEYVPDGDTELYFKAADVLVLPYTHVFQSGVLFLGYNFGLPVIAADVGSLKEDIVEDMTGYVFEPRNADSLAAALERYFRSELYHLHEVGRARIRRFAFERYSWVEVGNITAAVYKRGLGENCQAL